MKVGLSGLGTWLQGSAKLFSGSLICEAADGADDDSGAGCENLIGKHGLMN